MKKTIISALLCSASFIAAAQDYDHHFLLAGASFAVPENGWFELVCEAFNAEPMNKAVSGEAIYHTAMDMYNGTFYTAEELERTDAFIIMHVHNQDVAATNGIKENYEDYTYDDIRQSYPLAYDYVIKKYKADCRALKDNPESHYYGTADGKPATIILCTHWHDSRTTYNAAIRTLAERWGLPLVKWDDNIGFTRNQPDPDGSQPSLKYAQDTERIARVTYGWHPLRGKGQYIQKKMAWICMAELEKLFGTLPVSVSVSEKSRIVTPGEKAYFFAAFTGVPPWDFTYTVNGEEHTLDSIAESPLLIPVSADSTHTAVLPVAVSNATNESGEVSGQADIYLSGQHIAPAFDAFVHEYNPTTAYVDADHLEVKGNTPDWSREAFLSFDLTALPADAERIALRTYYYDCIYPNDKNIKETHHIEIAGNTSRYATLTWNGRPDDFTPITEVMVTADELNTYIDWDVTTWVQEQVAAGHTYVTLRLRYGNTDAGGLLYFYSSEAADPHKPGLYSYPDHGSSGLQAAASAELIITTDPQSKTIRIGGITRPCHLTLYTANGQACLARQIGVDTAQEELHMPHLTTGIYLLGIQDGSHHQAYKVVL